MDRYLEAVLLEIASYQRDIPIKADTVFFGGGTPTLFGSHRICKLLEAIRSTFDISDDAEISIEMNPATADSETLFALKKSGVNRISLGVQSFVETELQLLGRAHTANHAIDAIQMISEAGFENFNLDLMYAIPTQTVNTFAYSLEKALSFSPPHLSIYSLILEEGTDFWKQKDSLVFPHEKDELKMYQHCAEMLKSKGYEHYEISNYAKKGRVCRHNLRYWQLSPYIGIGPAAHSYFENRRFYNSNDIAAYIERPLHQKELEETVDRQILAEEYAMLGLRTANGISLSRYQAIAERSFAEGKDSFLQKCCHEGYLLIDGDKLRLTDKGFYVSNAIIGEFLA